MDASIAACLVTLRVSLAAGSVFGRKQGLRQIEHQTFHVKCLECVAGLEVHLSDAGCSIVAATDASTRVLPSRTITEFPSKDICIANDRLNATKINI